ncbi:glycosyltransferase family 4 protein [Pontibacter harenae]|uniref:glycosyltransferase family 4 protein n=1 Tax=Pontibacter harenae TaxID=2894083 RepID=UPI001E374CFB|nr:glycosyltransferase family 4 protein [Pontibacter harenae]MCC9166156.1 glycosyltransferase family 4 protein [Pontibacter harenae]
MSQKIIHILFDFNVGGTENMLVDIINEQAKSNNVVLVIVNNQFDANLIGKIKLAKVHCINRVPKSRNLYKILQLNYLVFSLKPDVIHFHNYNGIKLIKTKTKALKCLTIHDVNVPLQYLKWHDKVIAISKAVKKDVLLRANTEVKVIYNGIATNEVGKRKARDLIENKFKIIQVSRLEHKKKGQDILLKAVANLVHEKGIKNIALDFIGAGSSLPYLESLITELKLEDNVNFLGLKDREFIYKNLKNYDLAVQPSVYEGFGLTVVEAMAARLNILVSDIDGPMEVINHGQYGYFFENGNILDCSSKLEEIIHNKVTKQNIDLIESAYLYAKENFDIKKTALKYLEEYSI